MIHQSIARKYARGLFNVGEKDGRYREYLEELTAIITLLEKEEKLRRALMLPILEVEKRKELLTDVVRAAGISVSVSNVLTMLMERNRMGYLTMFRDAYSDLVDEKEGKVKGTVWSAFPLDGAMLGRIAEVLQEKWKKTVVLNVVEDKSLMGGIKININGTIIDGSVKRQLETLKENILKE